MSCVLSASSQDQARSYTETSKTSADTETSFAIKSVESTCSSRGKDIDIKMWISKHSTRVVPVNQGIVL